MCRSLKEPGELVSAAETPCAAALTSCTPLAWSVVGTPGNGVVTTVRTRWVPRGTAPGPVQCLTVGSTVAYSGLYSGSEFHEFS